MLQQFFHFLLQLSLLHVLQSLLLLSFQNSSFAVVIFSFVEEQDKEPLDSNDELAEGDEPDMRGSFFEDENDIIFIGEFLIALLGGYFVEFEVVDEGEKPLKGHVVVLKSNLVKGHGFERFVPVLAVMPENFLEGADPFLVQGPAAIDEFDSLVEDHYFLLGLFVALALCDLHLLNFSCDFVFHGFLYIGISA